MRIAVRIQEHLTSQSSTFWPCGPPPDALKPASDPPPLLCSALNAGDRKNE